MLRHLDPARLILYGGRRPEHDDWRRHRLQSTEEVFVATVAAGAERRVVGTLECRLVAGAHGWLDRLYVAPGSRRRGIASGLLRAAVGLARERGLAELRETIPSVLAPDPASGLWRPHLPVGEWWGGIRSFGATANACARADQPCAIVGAPRRHAAQRGDRIGAILALPIARSAIARTRRVRAASSARVLRELLLGDLAAVAGVPLAR